MATTDILIGSSQEGEKIYLKQSTANRHGLIAGATGTGKTITLQVLAEQFSKAGVPVFTADVKSDLSGLAQAGKEHKKITERIEKIGIEGFKFQDTPVAFWDLFGENGLPIRTTILDMGPLLLSRLFELNDTQTGVLQIAFRVSKDQNLPLIDIKDLKAVLNHLADNAKDLQMDYGNISKASIGAILRDVLALEDAGANAFFGEPALNLNDLMRFDSKGRGIVNILDATKLVNDARLYSTFLMWLLTEIFETLDEVGDPEKPRLVFFFDEAHLLFRDAPKVLIERIETVVRLIRSKGVGVYFVTQNPMDVPDSVLGQLGNRIQHALRSFSPKDQKAVKVAAQTFRPNPDFKAEQVITQLGIGESLVSVLDEKGMPTVVQKVLNAPPFTKIGPIAKNVRTDLNEKSPLHRTYTKEIDRESAYEMLKKRQKQKSKEEDKTPAKKVGKKARSYRRQTAGEAFFKSFMRSIASRLGTLLTKVLLNALKKK